MRRSIVTAVAAARPPRRGRTPRRPRALVRGIATMTAGAVLAVTAGGAAVADDVYNTIDGTTAGTALDLEPEAMSLAVGGAERTTTLRLQQRNSSLDGLEGCNVSTSNPARFAIRSSNMAVATVTPAEVEFTRCSLADGTNPQERTITVKTGSVGGTSTITLELLPRAVTAGTFDLRPATFVVTAVAPPADPPTVAVLGVDRASYVKGSPPSPSCRATHPDGRTVDFAAVVVKAVPGGDGLGEWVARCSYVESQGATPIVSSKAYELTDSTAPVVRYAVEIRENAAGWVRQNQRVQWSVTEPESPSWLAKSPGCADADIVTDGITDLTCTATSYNGVPTTVTTTVRRDATAPTVDPRVTSPLAATVDGVPWYRGVATIEWTPFDALSGLVPDSLRSTVTTAPLTGTTTTVGQGRGQISRVVVNDVAGNVGEGVVRGINVDATAPEVAAVAGAPVYHDGTRGWYRSSASVVVTATDPFVSPLERGSGLAQDPSGARTVTQPGVSRFVARDNVGYETVREVDLPIDATAPEVTATPSARAHHDGTRSWYKDSLSIVVTAADPAVAPYGTGSGLEDDPAGTHQFAATGSYTPVARDNVGNETTLPAIPFWVDARAPEVTAEVASTPAYVAGTTPWFKDEVSVVVDAHDPGTAGVDASGLAEDPTGTKTVTAAGLYSVTASDKVGHTASSRPVDLAIDSTAPTLSVDVEPADYDDGTRSWYQKDVTLDVKASDPVVAPDLAASGLAEDPTGTVTFTSTGSYTPVVRDNVGHVTQRPAVAYFVDSRKPTITPTLPTSQFDGWYADSVTLKLLTQDAGTAGVDASGIAAGRKPADSHVYTQTGTHTFVTEDNVGHTSDPVTVSVKVDSAKPTTAITCPSGPVVKGRSAAAGWTAQDEANGSGLVTPASGTLALDTTAVGMHTAAAPVAKDRVQHESTPATCSYRVVYDYSGFFAPVDNAAVNQVKAGSAVPVKFALGGDQGLLVLGSTPTAIKVACPSSTVPVDAVEETVLASTSGLRYDALSQQYHYTWKTASSFAGTCQKLTVKLADGEVKTALFKFTK